MLITSRGTGRWIIPKGWAISGLDGAGTAAQEAYEEAGVYGIETTSSLGHYAYEKQQNNGLSTRFRVEVHAIEVQRLIEDYPESIERERAWFSPEQAARLVKEPELSKIFLGFSDINIP